MAGEVLDNTGRGDVGWHWPAIHPEGRRIGLALGAAALFVLLVLGWSILGWLLLFAAVATFAFFRDPERVVPQAQRDIVAPADGLVTAIRQVETPRELCVDNGSGTAGLRPGPVTRVSIFMSIFDVHINRAPIGGEVRRVVYMPGRFVNADLDKASDDNERQHILIERGDGVAIGMTQIAGLVARRIVPFVKPGDIIAAGQRIGLIRFGSRVDVYLPLGTDPLVILGQRVIAGETVLARFGETKYIEGYLQ